MRAEGADDPRSIRDRKADFVWAAVLFALALIARLYQLGAKPLWLDEVLTKQRAALAIPALINDSIRNNHSPLFFLIEHVIAGAAPGSLGLRLLPAIAGTSSAALVFAIGRAAGLRAGAVLAGLFAALAPQQVAFGQEARSYTLMLALILVALWGLLQLATYPTRAAIAWSSGGLRTAWIAYGLGTAGALLTLGDALLWFVVSNVAMLVAILPRIASPKAFLKRWCILQGIIILATAPVYLAIFNAANGHVFSSFLWIPPLTRRLVWTDAASLYGLRSATMVSMRLLNGPIPYLVPIMLALGAVGFAVLHHRRRPRMVLLIATIGPGFILGLSSLIHPMLLPRYLLWSAAPFFVVAGAAIESLPVILSPAALALVATVLAINLLPYYQAETKPRWDLAAAFVAHRLRPNDVVLLADGFASLMLNTYLGKSIPPVARPVETTKLDEARLALTGSGRIWAIYGRAGQGKMPSKSDFFGNALAIGVPGTTKRIGREITIEKIDPPENIRVNPNTADAQRSLVSTASSGSGRTTSGQD